MRRPGGPELKMPELKVPVWLADLFNDLRDRRLLPLVALVVVAIVAVPFLLRDEAERPSEAPVRSAASAAASAAGAGDARLAVVEAKPGLRDYRKRLKGRTPTDPFEQRFAGPSVEAGQLGSQSGTGEAADEVTSTSVTAESDSTPGADPAAPGGTPPPAVDGDDPGLKFFEFVLDVQISRTEVQPDGSKKMGEPKVRRRVPGLTPLPSEETPVVTTMGVNLVKERVMLMVSNEVTSVEGDATCVAGRETCQLLEVKPGFPLLFTYGPDAVRYKVKIVKVDVIWLTPKQAARRSAQERGGLVQSFSK